MSKVVDEYIGYVWYKPTQCYKQVGASLSYSYEDCKRFFDEYKVVVGWEKYSDWDFTKYFIKMRRITYTDWEVIYD